MFLSKSLSFILGIYPDKGGELQLWAGLKQHLVYVSLNCGDVRDILTITELEMKASY